MNFLLEVTFDLKLLLMENSYKINMLIFCAGKYESSSLFRQENSAAATLFMKSQSTFSVEYVLNYIIMLWWKQLRQFSNNCRSSLKFAQPILLGSFLFVPVFAGL